MSKNKNKIPAQEGKRNEIFIPAALVLFTLIVYSGVYKLGFTNWDDTMNVTENPAIRNFSFASVKTIFTTSFIGMYVPLTMFSYAIENALFGLNAKVFHVVNLLLHLINVLLVFSFVRKLKPDVWVAALIAAIFAVHPLNVESVAWVSGRSTLLYTLYLLASIICYENYIDRNERKQLYFSLLLFIPALLAKSSAIILPVVLVAIDLYAKRPFVKKTIFEKIPFFLLSFVFGLITLAIRTPAASAVTDAIHYNITERIMLASYAVLFYVIKFLIPLKLCIYYPYPEKVNGHLPVLCYLAPVILGALVFFIFRKRKIIHGLLFGFILFLLPLLLVIQLVPFESVNFVADRYVYLPSVGLLFLLFSFLRAENKSGKNSVLMIAGVYVLLVSFVAYNRVGVWKSSVTLFSDMIEKNPTLPYPYHSRGHEYFEQKKYAEALADFNQSLALKPDYFEANYNRGLTKYSMGDATGAVIDFDKALLIEPSYTSIYYSRALAKSMLLKYKEAIEDFNQAESSGIKTADLYINRGNSEYNLPDYKTALTDYEKALEVQPDYVIAWDHIGPAKYNLKDYKGAVEAYTKAIALGTTYQDAYRDRGIIKGMLDDFNGSIDDFTNAIRIHPNDAVAYYNRGLANQKLNKITEACNDWKKASELGSAEGKIMAENACR